MFRFIDFSKSNFHIDAKKKTHLKTVIFFERCSNFLSKSDKKVKFGKSVRLRLMSMKKGFGSNFDKNLKKTVFFHV